MYNYNIAHDIKKNNNLTLCEMPVSIATDHEMAFQVPLGIVSLFDARWRYLSQSLIFFLQLTNHN